MMPSLPCKKCGQIDDLEMVNPIGIIDGHLIEWDCFCGTKRFVDIDDYIPLELINKAVEAEMAKLDRTGTSDK